MAYSNPFTSLLNNQFGTPPTTVRSYTTAAPPSYPGTSSYTPTTSVGGGSSINFQALLDRMQGLQTQANRAGNQRFKRLMGAVNRTYGRTLGPGGLYDQASQSLSQLGGTESRRIADTQFQDTAKAQQDLISHGLGNTTIRSSVDRGIASDAERSRQDLMERLSAQRLGLLTQRAGAEAQAGEFKANSLLSKSTEGPDLGMYAQLIQQLAANGGLGTGGAMSGAAGATVAVPQTGGDWRSKAVASNPRMPGESLPQYYARIGLGG